MRSCPKCNRTFPDDVEFCSHDGAVLASPTDVTTAEPMPGLARRYRITRPLGSGGMGTVFLAEQVALDAAQAGFPVVIVNPTAPVGDHDFKPTPTGKTVVDFLRGAMPAYLDTGLNVVDADDTADGHLLAFERGKVGERYILGCENMTLRDIFEHLASISGVRAPRAKIPYPVALAAGAASTGWAYLTGKEPRAPLNGVRMARKKMWVTIDKAKAELGYNPGPASAGLRKAVEWFRANNYC